MKAVGAFLKELLFPKYCFGCAQLGVYICLSCRDKLAVISRDRCPYCQKASYFGLTHPACRRYRGLDGVKSLLRYDFLVRKIIKQIKYQLVTSAVDEFFSSIPTEKKLELLFYKELADQLTFLPVPLHPKRLRERGFNQSLATGRCFAEMLDLALADHLIIRIKNTKPQAAFTASQERYRNILGAFSRAAGVDDRQIAGKKFIVFDDVWTTGATIKEIAKVLKKHGAVKVFALTIAR